MVERILATGSGGAEAPSQENVKAECCSDKPLIHGNRLAVGGGRRRSLGIGLAGSIAPSPSCTNSLTRASAREPTSAGRTKLCGRLGGVSDKRVKILNDIAYDLLILPCWVL